MIFVILLQKLFNMKRTLVIHPKDRSTDFLKPIYANIVGATIVTENWSKEDVNAAIDTHDRIIMMGHGSPYGLFSIGRFIDTKNGFIIDAHSVKHLRGKECIFIWCYASDFVNHHNLKGFSTGMFISEVGEAYACRIIEPTQQMVDGSNSFFVDTLSENVDLTLREIYDATTKRYSEYAKRNTIAHYNNSRLVCIE